MKKKDIEKTELEKQLEDEIENERGQAQDEESAAEEESAPRDPLAALTAERDELKDQVLRIRADFDNYRKRMMRDLDTHRKMAAKTLLEDLLPVVDNLERALGHAEDFSGGVAEGVAMVLKQFGEVLSRNGVSPIVSVGEAFDPNVHEAIMTVDSADVPENHVVQEFQKGYRLGDHVLRPSKVSVSRGPAGNEEVQE